ncbi:MAG: hypothetical protein HY540_00195, partial [Deltaproteobacteria bacterium]|nr:hypothetical protein [Deltaproteobacteria bacterium]
MREDTMERLRQLQLEREHNRAILHPDAISHPVHQAGMPADAMLAVFQDRFTYTFLFQHEVSSIHFDRRRGEIFYRGHNIANLVLGDSQKRILQGLA